MDLPSGTTFERAVERLLPICVKCSRANGRFTLAMECEVCGEELDSIFVCDGCDHFHENCFCEEVKYG
jgi:hypothetical protein